MTNKADKIDNDANVVQVETDKKSMPDLEAEVVTETEQEAPKTGAEPQRLTFTSDKGASRSTWYAALLVVLIVGWMGSGFIIPSENTDPVIERKDLSLINN